MLPATNKLDFLVINFQIKIVEKKRKSKMQRERVLWAKESMQSTHPSDDETAGRTLAQNHRNKQKMEFLTFSQKLLFRRHDVEAWVLSKDCEDYLKVLVGNINHSTSVSPRFTCFNFIS